MSDLNFKQRAARWIWVNAKKFASGLWIESTYSGYDPDSCSLNKRPPAMAYTHFRILSSDRYWEIERQKDRISELEKTLKEKTEKHESDIKEVEKKFEFELIHLKDLIQEKDMVIEKVRFNCAQGEG